MRLAAGQGPSQVWLLHEDPSLARPGLIPTESSPTFLPPAFPSPGMGQAQKTGGSVALGGVGGGPLPIPAPSLSPGAPTTCGSHTFHCDPGLWPSLLLTQWFPIIWGKREGGHTLSSPPDTGVEVGELQPLGGHDSPQKWRQGASLAESLLGFLPALPGWPGA